MARAALAIADVRVFDRLGLVHDRGEEADAFQVGRELAQLRMADDVQIGPVRFRCETPKSRAFQIRTRRPGRNLRASVRQFSMSDLGQTTSAGCGLAGRCVLAEVGQPRERLHGFAEAHVIGEDAAAPGLREGAEEFKAIALIRAELGLERRRRSGAGCVLDSRLRAPRARGRDIGRR